MWLLSIGVLYPFINYWKFLINYEKERKRIIVDEDYQIFMSSNLTNKMVKIKWWSQGEGLRQGSWVYSGFILCLFRIYLNIMQGFGFFMIYFGFIYGFCMVHLRFIQCVLRLYLGFVQLELI